MDKRVHIARRCALTVLCVCCFVAFGTLLWGLLGTEGLINLSTGKVLALLGLVLLPAGAGAAVAIEHAVAKRQTPARRAHRPDSTPAAARPTPAGRDAA